MMRFTDSSLLFICRVIIMVVVAIMLQKTPLAAQDMQPEYLMMSDPELKVPDSVLELPDGAILLWQRTLRRPEPDLVKAAADSIADAHVRGFSGLDVCGPDLVEVLKSSDSPAAVTFAISRALIGLNKTEAASLLFQAAQQGDTQLRLLIEPALAKWSHQPAIDVWIQRLKDRNTPRRELILACEGVMTTRTAAASPFLVQIAVDQNRSADVRLSAARAAGAIGTNGLADAAVPLADGANIDALCAVTLVAQDDGGSAQSLLTTLASHKNSAISSHALQSLLKIDAALVIPFAADAMSNADPKVRQCGLDAYIALVNEERLPMIARLLSDPHPNVRTNARRALFKLTGDDAFREQILELAMSQLQKGDWRSQEQATVLLAALDYKPAALRLVELLRSERPEVLVTSAWGLRVLAVPETADGIIEQIMRESNGKPSVPYGDMQVGHLFEACAVLGEKRALDSLPRYLSRDVTREKSRSAAVWAAGKLLEGEPDETLAEALMDRVKDINDNVEELALVRRMSAISLGRMHAVSQLQHLRDFIGDEIYATQVAHAIGWAVEVLSGDQLPVAPAPTIVRRGWPIEPSFAER